MRIVKWRPFEIFCDVLRKRAACVFELISGFSSKTYENIRSLFIPLETIKSYQKEYSEWLHLKNLNAPDGSSSTSDYSEWRACPYFDQLNVALNASHSIFNYSNFLALLPNKKSLLSREPLVLDEGHLLETELVNDLIFRDNC